MANADRPCRVNIFGAANTGGKARIVEEDRVAVAMVIPAINTVLGDGMESDDKCIAPSHTPHLIWDCLLDGYLLIVNL